MHPKYVMYDGASPWRALYPTNNNVKINSDFTESQKKETMWNQQLVLVSGLASVFTAKGTRDKVDWVKKDKEAQMGKEKYMTGGLV